MVCTLRIAQHARRQQQDPHCLHVSCGCKPSKPAWYHAQPAAERASDCLAAGSNDRCWYPNSQSREKHLSRRMVDIATDFAIGDMKQSIAVEYCHVYAHCFSPLSCSLQPWLPPIKEKTIQFPVHMLSACGTPSVQVLYCAPWAKGMTAESHLLRSSNAVSPQCNQMQPA